MQRQVRWMEFARFQSHNVESLPCIALVQVFAALWCSGVLVLWLVCACKPCTQPSSQTLQSHEWRHSAYSPCKSAPQRSCGSGYKASSVARQARSLLPFNLLKVEPASHAVNTATSNLWQQFICNLQRPAVEEVQLIKYKVSTGHQEFLISLSFCMMAVGWCKNGIFAFQSRSIWQATARSGNCTEWLTNENIEHQLNPTFEARCY